jgi:hypothetical protein
MSLLESRYQAKEEKDYLGFLFKNDLAFYETGCESDAAFGIVQTSRSEEHSKGDAHFA